MEAHVSISFSYSKLLTYLAFSVVVVITSYYFMELRFSLFNLVDREWLKLLLSNTAAKPFQFRVLVPWLVGWLSAAGLPPPFSFSEFWLRLIEFISLCLLVVAFQHYLSLFFRSEKLSMILSFALFLVLPYNFILSHSPWFPSDMPSILFFTLGLILLYRQKWAFYYPLFALATLNRETTIFLIFIYLVTAIGKHRPTSIAAHCLGQLLAWVAIKFFLLQLYAGNPGAGLFEFWFSKNIRLFGDPTTFALLFSSLGYCWLPVILFYRLIRDDFVRRSVLVIFPVFIGMMLVGFVVELRIYGEMIPVVLTALLLILKELFQREGAMLPIEKVAD